MLRIEDLNLEWELGLNRLILNLAFGWLFRIEIEFWNSEHKIGQNKEEFQIL